jgi:hypothetical protein
MRRMRGPSPLPSSVPSSPSLASGRWIALGIVTAALVVVTAGSFACGTSPIGVEACQKIERVRCESAQACGINLGSPVHPGDTPEKNVAACIRYYDDQCLHGIAGPKEPGPQAVDACVNAIITGDCSVVKEPQTHSSCDFLVPPETVVPPDAAVEAEASSG